MSGLEHQHRGRSPHGYGRRSPSPSRRRSKSPGPGSPAKPAKVFASKQEDLADACWCGDSWRIVSLMNSGVRLGREHLAETRHGYLPLHHAARFGHRTTTEVLIGARADPNLADQDGRTPLRLAVVNSRPEVVRLLLAAGANANASTPETGRTPLHLCGWAGSPEIAQMLIGAGAVLDRPCAFGHSPLDYAHMGRYKTVRKAMSAAGATRSGADRDEDEVRRAEFGFTDIAVRSNFYA